MPFTDDFAINNAEIFDNFLETAVIVSKRIWQRYLDEIWTGIQLADQTFLIPFQQNGYESVLEKTFNTIRYDKPITILLGKHDHIVGYENMIDLINSFSRATFAILNHADHNLQIEQPDRFNLYVTLFLQNAIVTKTQ